jgi:hypothetical protein
LFVEIEVENVSEKFGLLPLCCLRYCDGKEEETSKGATCICRRTRRSSLKGGRGYGRGRGETASGGHSPSESISDELVNTTVVTNDTLTLERAKEVLQKTYAKKDPNIALRTIAIAIEKVHASGSGSKIHNAIIERGADFEKLKTSASSIGALCSELAKGKTIGPYGAQNEVLGPLDLT